MRIWGTLLLAAALVAAPAAAHAASDDNYTPVDPSRATLAGSTVSGECHDARLWLDYAVTVTDPDAVAAATGDALLVIDDAGRSVTVTLGPLDDGSVDGRVAWPEAADAVLRRLPGGGTAAGTVNATIQVQTQSVAPLAYPIAVPACGADAAPAGALAVTGVSAWVPGLGIAGVALIVAGTLFALSRRRRLR